MRVLIKNRFLASPGFLLGDTARSTKTVKARNSHLQISLHEDVSVDFRFRKENVHRNGVAPSAIVHEFSAELFAYFRVKWCPARFGLFVGFLSHLIVINIRMPCTLWREWISPLQLFWKTLKKKGEISDRRRRERPSTDDSSTQERPPFRRLCSPGARPSSTDLEKGSRARGRWLKKKKF